MALRKLRARAAAAVVAAAMSSFADAAVVTLDFDDPQLAGSTVTSNLIQKGFRISPNCHYDLGADFLGFQGSQWLGWDGANCGEVFNPNFLGPAELMGPFTANHDSVLWVDLSGRAFTLLSLFVALADWTVESSKGGFLALSSDATQTTVEFDGPEWSGIAWLLFTIPGSGAGAPFGFDNFVAQVPSYATKVPVPPTLALIGIALAALGLAHWQKPRAPRWR